ncbi:MAG: ribonuclease P protein component [Propionicimonas sp.]|uniref:ribonuclease P protein component n=1 Tax=Propionicimonas sp. TaxID=1955623 RepID=UPI002B20A067|nr:ribonuclease P protein component [Propionicimonas sp.]MEA4944444.1 ribonuclease P protein component [Propionicimonas sp.]MEA5054292.1 ribonuclease P protein component [Propionicimonas sp.]
MLPAASRIRTPEDFRGTMRQGVRSGRRCLVLHARRRTELPSRAGFVVSKVVGGAVQRNRVKRRLRHLAAGEFGSLAFPVDIVVRALPPAADGDLAGDFHSALEACVRKLAA